MTFGLIMAHSGWRYIVILVLAVALLRYVMALVTRGKWSALDDRLTRATPIILDIQLVLGLVVWILQQRWTGTDPLVSWEHSVTMIVVVAIAHVTSTRVKRIPDDAGKFRTALIGFAVAGLLLALGIARITYVL